MEVEVARIAAIATGLAPAFAIPHMKGGNRHKHSGKSSANSSYSEPQDGESSSQLKGSMAPLIEREEKARSEPSPSSPSRSAKRSRSLDSIPSSFLPFKKPAELPLGRARDGPLSPGPKQEPPQLKTPPMQPSSRLPSSNRAPVTPKSSTATGIGQPCGGSKRKHAQEHSTSTQSTLPAETASGNAASAEVQELRRAVVAATAHADQAQRNYLMVYHMMLEAEALLRRQAGAGAEGIAAIYSAASKLVSSDMLLHLPLTKAHMLANLQVEIKMHANTVFDALNEVHQLVRRPQEVPHAESTDKRNRASPPSRGPKREE